MKGLPTSSRSSNCFGNFRSESVLTRIRRVFKGPPRSAEYPPEKEKEPYRHVPTHAASDFLRTTTTQAMRRAEEATQHEQSTMEIKMEEG
jgi:hypothetical protein